MTFEYEITEINRRLSNLIKIGTIKATKYDDFLPVVKVSMGELESAWLPLMQLRAGPDSHWWPLEVGEQVLILSTSGDTCQGVVLGSIHQNTFPAQSNSAYTHKVTYSDGAVLEYNRESHHLKMQLPEGATIELIANGGFSVVGDVAIQGNIKASGDISDTVRSMAEDREIYNTHNHAGVTSGSAATLTTQQRQ